MTDDQPNTENGITEEQKREVVTEALRTVVDPEIGLNIVQLGLVREIQISDDKLHVVMILTTPFCPYGPQLLEAARIKAQEALGVPTTIEVGMEMWDPSMAEDGILSDWGLY
jgi:metal-sulfur cluster biosynthetic enzyme